MRTLGLITARGGSQAIPNKNLADLGGRPLIAWTIEAALLAESLARVIVSTDSPAIAEASKTLGAEVPFLRPSALAGHDSRSVDVVQHALGVLPERYETVMILQPTSPFRLAADIDGAVSLLGSSGGDSVISLVPVGDHHPARMKLIRNGYISDYDGSELVEGQPRHSLPRVYLRNGAIYLAKQGVIDRGRFQGDAPLPWVMPIERSLNIDEAWDLTVARALVDSGWRPDETLCAPS